MREIKFRVWNKDYTGKFIVSIQDLMVTDTFTSFEEASINQYTGLKDKNGKEIYEEDIVTSLIWGYPSGDAYDNNEPMITEVIGKVYWAGGNGGFAIHWLEENQAQFFNTCWNSLEVIGNIYENPELLEKHNDELQRKDIHN